MNIKQMNYVVTALVVLVMLSLTAGAFVLSFDALRKEAVTNGIDPSLAWIFPVIVDLAIIAGGMFVIWSAVNKLVAHKRGGYAFILIVTAVSVTLNAFHAQHGWMSVVYSIIPPIMLASTIFIVERMIEHMISQEVEEHKLQVAYRSLVESNKQTVGALRQLEAAYTQLQSNYSELASYRPLMKVISPDVMLALQAKAGLISMDDFVAQQSRYTRRNQAEDFFARVTVDMEAVEVNNE